SPPPRPLAGRSGATSPQRHRSSRVRSAPAASGLLIHVRGSGGGPIIHEYSCKLPDMSSARPAGRMARPPNFSAFEFRASLGMFATGVTVVTARTRDGGLVGLTASSFNSVSLSPPLVLWSLAHRAGSMAAFSKGHHYAINVLAAEQQALAERFA